MEGIDSHNVSPELSDAMARNKDLSFGCDIILINDSISIKHSRSLGVEKNNTNYHCSDQTGSVGIGELKIYFFTFDVGIGELNSNTLFISRFNIKTLNKRFNFQTGAGKIFGDGICYLKDFIGGSLALRIGEDGSSEFHVRSCTGDEVNP